MKISFVQELNSKSSQEAVFTFFSEEDAAKAKKSKSDMPINFAVKNGNFYGKKGEAFSDYTSRGMLLYIGAGKEKKISAHDLRTLGAKVVKIAKSLKVSIMHISKISLLAMNDDLYTSFIEGIMLADYDYSLKLDSGKKAILKNVYIEGTASSSVVTKTKKITDAVITCRKMVNENAGVLHPAEMEKKAKELAKKYKLKLTVLSADKLKSKGLNLINAVGQAAENKSRLIILEYSGAGSKKKTSAFIGKGVTFDTGGLNLKPGASMTDMRMDMSGAAAVFGAMQAIASLKLKVNVIGVLAVAENAIGPKAVKPGDIIKGYNGKTVEILNTDAEGRLILADALSYIEKNYKPSAMVDLATLTGAVIMALGSSHAALMTEDSELKNNIILASEETDEKIWPLPFNESYFDDMKSDVADVRNIGRDREAGTIRGAVFLREFVKDTSWAHLDIAGTAWSSKPGDLTSWYGTGYGVRLLTNLSQKLL